VFGILESDDLRWPGQQAAVVAGHPQAGEWPVDWPYQTECCGAGLSITRSPMVARLAHRLLAMARRAGANCLAVACPLCETNLDLRQEDARKAHGEIPETPVLYLTQLLGLALGLSGEELGLDALMVNPEPLTAALDSLTTQSAGPRPPAGAHPACRVGTSAVDRGGCT